MSVRDITVLIIPNARAQNESEGAQAFCRKHPDLLHSRGNLNPVLSGLILIARLVNEVEVELVSKELNHLAAILHVYARGLNFMK